MRRQPRADCPVTWIFATSTSPRDVWLWRWMLGTSGRLRSAISMVDSLSAMVDHCLGVVFYPVIPAGSWFATTKYKLNLLQPVSSGGCVAVTDIIALGKSSGVARIDITNAGRAVCAAQGTVTVISRRGGSS